jgi:hypothetical protein
MYDKNVLVCFRSENDLCVPRDTCHFSYRLQQKKVNGALCARYIVDKL